MTFTGCSGGSPAASSFTAKGTLKFTPSASDNECTDAEDPGANGTLKLKYGGGIAPSTFSGEIWVPDPTGTDLEAESGNEAVTGSYANNGQTVAGVPESLRRRGECRWQLHHRREVRRNRGYGRGGSTLSRDLGPLVPTTGRRSTSP